MAYQRRTHPSSTRSKDNTSVQESPPPPPPSVEESTPISAFVPAPALTLAPAPDWTLQDMMRQFIAFMGFMQQQAVGDEPSQAAEWLKNMERIFDVMECTEAQKVVFVSHVLLGETDVWWQTTKKIVEADGCTATWAEFEYVKKFDELSQFAPPVTTDESKTRQFEEGLREDIRGSVSMLQLPTYAAVLEKAMILDACSSRGSRTGDKALGKRIMDQRDFK
ncbi:hypothetical protein NE237_000507 [Protea cynaroides]|uniref:Retrotransposon gag domain-containing protein n=1 Tax=Protea cynaroides TaxID=273540 RepID=A0A9Q0KRL0_9MAGN|nr:hypothetical protein NE237_000507 [Protea cynaroides]